MLILIIHFTLSINLSLNDVASMVQAVMSVLTYFKVMKDNK
ncbi:hypothetical protein [Apilactobacillus xinyiensis]|nr:hypothetical protein [Apilactobacillus xinyiensis]